MYIYTHVIRWRGDGVAHPCWHCISAGPGAQVEIPSGNTLEFRILAEGRELTRRRVDLKLFKRNDEDDLRNRESSRANQPWK